MAEKAPNALLDKENLLNEKDESTVLEKKNSVSFGNYMALDKEYGTATGTKKSGLNSLRWNLRANVSPALTKDFI